MAVSGGTDLMTLHEAAERLCVDPKTVRRYIAAGRLVGYRVGAHMIRVDAAEVNELLRPIPVTTAVPPVAVRPTVPPPRADMVLNGYALFRCCGDEWPVPLFKRSPVA